MEVVLSKLQVNFDSDSSCQTLFLVCFFLIVPVASEILEEDSHVKGFP